ncbi:MAG: hypothetical protein QHH43_08875 [Candidatus Saccharicenans sp.]|jgi:hypothetical protein|nr:hypothetical protein [Candidatus Saccharicenans sp.]MDH7575854.1 hypothetical protein [Candidatus Saccharicenans sp.]
MTLDNLELQLERMPKGSRLILRDDLYDLSPLKDILEKSATGKILVSLLDTGRLSPEELEWLGEFPFSLYTSDAARQDFQVLNHIHLVLEPLGCGLFYFLQGELKEDSALWNNVELFQAIYVSGREKDRPLEILARLAEEVSRSRSTLVYYHHKKPEENLAQVCLKNCWLHISNKNLEEDAEIMILDLLEEIKKHGGRPVIHVDRGQSYHFLRRLAEAGAFLEFNLPPLEPDSKVFALAGSWRKKKLPEKAYYLYREIMA